MVTRSGEIDGILRAIADPRRRAILQLLSGKDLPAGSVARHFRVSRPAVSRHLRVLRRARLVTSRRDGREHRYQLNPAPLRALDEWLIEYRPFWRASLTRLKHYVEASD